MRECCFLLKKTQNNTRMLRSFEKNICPTLQTLADQAKHYQTKPNISRPIQTMADQTSHYQTKPSIIRPNQTLSD